MATSAGAASLLTNGSFETGDFTGWTATAAAGSGGDLFITPGGASPVVGQDIAAPTDGSVYAVTDQFGPGAYSLTQSFIAAAGAMVLSFDFFAQTSADFADTGSLDHTGDPNQHARVDILTGAAGAFDVGAAIVETLIGPIANTRPDPFSSFSFALSGLTAGDSYQVRFAQVDNQGTFQMGVDNVVLTAAVPIPAGMVLLLTGIGVLGAARRRKTT